ncbi:MAG TPA: N-acetylmuramoyl-L-alanine amidase [Falsiroseomonas sp.]|jgi:N-acetylmuramoyl-L-alanine amidase|nr:N-acetylmuramoyl-L-alanine amidase [Falsiroseomonas sp.]
MIRRRGLASLLLAFAMLPPPRAADAATTASLAAEGSGARLTVALGPGERWRIRALVRPNRLLIDFPGSRWRGPARTAGAGPVSVMRNSRGQMVLDLTGPVQVTRATGLPGQLVVEIAPGPAAAWNRAAARKTVLAQGGGTDGLPLVVLDPGHGGRDPGAIGVKGTREKTIVLAAAQELRRLLEATGRCRVAMTRTGDRFVPLNDRVGFARRREAALFVSLHADSAPGARGASVYTLGDGSDALSVALARRENDSDRAGGLRLPSVSPEVQAILLSLMQAETRAGSARMAEMVVEELGGQVPLLPNTHRQAGFVVLKAPEIPSVLVELGFLSHAQDEAALRRPDHRAKLARALSRAIGGWLARARTAEVLATG